MTSIKIIRREFFQTVQLDHENISKKNLDVDEEDEQEILILVEHFIGK